MEMIWSYLRRTGTSPDTDRNEYFPRRTGTCPNPTKIKGFVFGLATSVTNGHLSRLILRSRLCCFKRTGCRVTPSGKFRMVVVLATTASPCSEGFSSAFATCVLEGTTNGEGGKNRAGRENVKLSRGPLSVFLNLWKSALSAPLRDSANPMARLQL